MKKRLLPLMLALVLCLGLTVPALAAEADASEETPVIEEVIPCQLVYVSGFSEGLAWIETSDGYGFIDKTGELVIPAVYDGIGPFSEGLAPVMQNSKWGFIDKTGKMAIPCAYDDVEAFSDGLALVTKGDKLGYIDHTGKEVIPCQYEVATPYYEGLALTLLNDELSFIDQTGKEVISCDYDSAGIFSEDLAAVTKNDRVGYIDRTGEEVIPCRYDYAYPFSEGLALVLKNDKYGYIDHTGEEAVPCRYEDATAFSEGLALVKKSGKWGYIDQTGKEVIPCQYDDAWGFFEGYAPAMKDGKWGYIDQTGKEVVPFQYDNAGTFSDGMAWVAQVPEISGDYGELPPLYGFVAIVTLEKPAEPEKAPLEVTASVSNWAKEQVDSAAASGLIADSLGDDYTVNITRAQFAAVSVKLYEAMSGETAPAAGDSPFADTSDPAVIQAEALGFAGGMGNGKFEPDSLVTREQAAIMLSRVYTKLGGEIPAVDATDFADDDEMSGYAKNAIAFMSGKEIVGGVGNNKFNPKGNASIEQALVIALRMFENLT